MHATSMKNHPTLIGLGLCALVALPLTTACDRRHRASYYVDGETSLRAEDYPFKVHALPYGWLAQPMVPGHEIWRFVNEDTGSVIRVSVYTDPQEIQSIGAVVSNVMQFSSEHGEDPVFDFLSLDDFKVGRQANGVNTRKVDASRVGTYSFAYSTKPAFGLDPIYKVCTVVAVPNSKGYVVFRYDRDASRKGPDLQVGQFNDFVDSFEMSPSWWSKTR